MHKKEIIKELRSIQAGIEGDTFTFDRINDLIAKLEENDCVSGAHKDDIKIHGHCLECSYTK